MTIYTPRHFAAPDHDAVARLIRDHPFATLVTPGAPEPVISHLPLLLVPGAESYGTLIGHMARANPHWKQAGDAESVAIFHGPHAYVSPSWYADPADAVPTWNYSTVHAVGRMTIVEDAAEARGVLDTLVARFESTRAAPWTFTMERRKRDALVGAIVAFRLRIRHCTAKFKLSQNRSAEDRRRVAAALDEEGYSDAAAVAASMRAAGGATGE